MKIIKTYLITIAALLCCVMVNAADFEVDGIYYNITSSAYMEVEVIGSSSSGEIEIPGTVVVGNNTYNVVSIKYEAFKSRKNLTSVNISEGVKRIGSYAFSGCSNLASISIPESVTSIEYGTFNNCTSLTSFVVPDGVTSIGGYAFFGCEKLSSIIIGKDVS